jgi:hypothetical protein
LSKKKVCSHCGVPREFSKEIRWESDGSAVLAKKPDHRVIFYEAKGMDKLLDNIEEVVGLPIDHIVIEGKRKSTYNYLESIFSNVELILIRAFLRRKVYETISGRGAIMGYGNYELVDFKKKEFIEVYGRNVYSRRLFSGDLAATFNRVEGLPAELQFEERDGGLVITVVPGEEVGEEIASRLQRRVLPLKPGNIHYERCPECDLPLDLKDYTWNLEEGTITDDATGRRMAILGAEGIDSVFRELEAELGEEIPRTIVEAQRQYVKETLQSSEVEQSVDYLVRQIALRGMGNLVHYEVHKASMQTVVENAIPPLLVAGMLQGIYELITAKESHCEYHREEGTLSINVTAV